LLLFLADHPDFAGAYLAVAPVDRLMRLERTERAAHCDSMSERFFISIGIA
jgi:hypothetical protein